MTTLQQIIEKYNMVNLAYDEMSDFERDILKYAEQEPCDDVVSRRAVLEMAYDMSEIDGEHFTEPCMVVDVEDIQKLPPITQKPETVTEFADCCRECGSRYGKLLKQVPKTGHWIINKDKSLARCSNCKFNLKDKDEIKLLGTFMQGYNYCPYCNTKMVEPQESEEEIGVYENKNIF